MLTLKSIAVLIVMVIVSTADASADAVTFDLTGTVTDDTGHAVAAADVYLDFLTSTEPGTYYSHASAVTNDAGFYEVVFTAVTGASGGGATALVRVTQSGFESDYRYFVPATDDTSQTLNVHLYAINRITAGDSMVVTVNPDDTICVNNVQDYPGLGQDYVCRTVRIVAPSNGVIVLEARATADGSHPPLETESVNASPCCSEQLANPATIQVSAGTEVMANIEIPYGSRTGQSFVLATAMNGVIDPSVFTQAVSFTVEASVFGDGGQGCWQGPFYCGGGYYDETPGNWGDAQVRPGTDVDLWYDDGGIVIGGLDGLEWVTFPVDVPQSGMYTVTFRTASPADRPLDSGIVNVGVYGVDASWIGNQTVPVSGAAGEWHQYVTWQAPTAIYLPAGAQTLTMWAAGGWYNLRRMIFTLQGTP